MAENLWVEAPYVEVGNRLVAARDEAGPDWHKEGDLGDLVDQVALVDPGDLVEGDEDKDPVASCKYRISIEGVDRNNRDIYMGEE